MSNNDLVRGLETAAISGKLRVNTVYPVRVVSVSENGQFVSVMHRTLEWKPDIDSSTIMLNAFREEIRATPKKPWVINDVPVAKIQFGQFKIKMRPVVGDDGIIEVFYNDISSLKRNGLFQAPDVIDIHNIQSCIYFATGAITHPEVDEDYPDKDTFEITSNTSKITINSPDDGAPAIILNSGYSPTTPAVLGDSLVALLTQIINLFNQHTHPESIGASTMPPNAQMVMSNILSDYIDVS